MDARNYVAGCSPAVGCSDGWVAVVDGQVYGPFASQSDAEYAYNAIKGGPAAPGGPAPAFGAVTLDCSRGQGAPVNGGCWCCIDGTWDTDPKYCRDHDWAVRCGNAGGGGSGGTVPQPSAPTSPGSGPSIPSVPRASAAAAAAAAVTVLDLEDIARALSLRGGELALLGVALALILVRR